jgi:hypothetical protein
MLSSPKLVESVISDISNEHRDNFHVVRLNGFIHTDDKIALREIWRQLGREMEVEDDLVGKVTSSHMLNIPQMLIDSTRATMLIHWPHYWLFYHTLQR